MSAFERARGDLGWAPPDTRPGDGLRPRRSRASVWRARLSLPVLVALPLLLWVGLCGLQAWSAWQGRALQPAGAALLLGTLLLLLVQTTVAVWAWQRTASRRMPSLLRWLWRALVLAGSATVLVWAVRGALPELPQWTAQALGRDPWGTVRTEHSADGVSLRLQGVLGQGDAPRVQALLAKSPYVQVLVLDLAEARLDDARQLAAQVRERRLATRVAGQCRGGCVLAFLAGQPRQTLPGAKLGLHRLSAGGFNPLVQPWLTQAWRDTLLGAGLDRHLVVKVLATPPGSWWEPEPDELRLGGVLSQPPRPLELELPDLRGAQVGAWVEAMSANPLWPRLEQRFPGVLQATAARLHALAERGAESPALQSAAQSEVMKRLPGLLAAAGPELRGPYVELLREQVAALAAVDAVACQALLQGDPAAHRRLPAALALREAEWLRQALDDLPVRTAPRPPTALELEVMQRALGARAPELLARVWMPPRGASALDCERAQGLLDAVAALPPAERRLALRLMFERR